MGGTGGMTGAWGLDRTLEEEGTLGGGGTSLEDVATVIRWLDAHRLLDDSMETEEVAERIRDLGGIPLVLAEKRMLGLLGTRRVEARFYPSVQQLDRVGQYTDILARGER